MNELYTCLYLDGFMFYIDI